MDFVGLNLVIPRGTTRTYRVTCDMDSVVEGDFGDTYALGIASAVDVIAEDSVGTGPDVIVHPFLTQQLVLPIRTISVAGSGSATVTPGTSMRETVGGVRYGLSYPGQLFRIVPTLEPVLVHRLRVRLNGNTACVDSVNVATSESERSLAPFVSVPRSTDSVSVDITPLIPIPVELGGRTLVLTVRWNPPVDPAVDPSGCHPGDGLEFGLDQGTITGEWDSSDLRGYNVRITGAVSGSRILTSAPPLWVMNVFLAGPAAR